MCAFNIKFFVQKIAEEYLCQWWCKDLINIDPNATFQKFYSLLTITFKKFNFQSYFILTIQKNRKRKENMINVNLYIYILEITLQHV